MLGKVESKQLYADVAVQLQNNESDAFPELRCVARKIIVITGQTIFVKSYITLGKNIYSTYTNTTRTEEEEVMGSPLR